MSLFHFYPQHGCVIHAENVAPSATFCDEDYALCAQFDSLTPLEISEMMESLSLSLANSTQEHLPSAPCLSPNQCGVCLECIADPSNLFTDSLCSHLFCKPCIAEHVQTELQKGNHAIKCPDIDCFQLLNFEVCKAFLPESTWQQWGSALAKACIPPEMIFYCPYDDCDGIFLKDDEDILQAECNNCHRLLCARCKIPWHAGYGCTEFRNKMKKKKGKENDTLLTDLARDSGWKQCPKCRFLVEKTWGCDHVTCRCGNQFCYACGEAWHSTHPSSCKPPKRRHRS